MATPLLSSESNLVGTLQIGIGTTTNTFTVIFKDKVTGNARTPQSTTKMFVIDKGSSTTPNPNYEIFYGDHTTTLGVTTFTGVVRGLEFWGTDISTGVTARKKTHVAGAEVGVVELHYYNDIIIETLQGGGDPIVATTYIDHAARDAALPTPIDGMQIYVQSFEVFEQFRNGTWWLENPVFTDATQRDAAIPVPLNGMKCYNTAVGLNQSYVTGSWMNDGLSSPVPNASTTVAGKVQEATLAELVAQTGTGTTGARLFINPTLTTTTGGTLADAGKIPLFGPTGQLPASAVTTSSYPSGGRLTFVSGTPVMSGSGTFTTIYYTSYVGDKISIYNGTSWQLYTFPEVSLSLAGLSADTDFNMYIYDNASVLTLEASTTGTSRQDGVLIKTGDATRRFLGTLRTTGTIGESAWQPNSQPSRLLLWNMYNRRQFSCHFAEGGGGSAITQTTRAYNNNSGNSLQFTNGLGEDSIYITSKCNGSCGQVSGTAFTTFALGIGIDTDLANTTYGGLNAPFGFNVNSQIIATYSTRLSDTHIIYITETASFGFAAQSFSWNTMTTDILITM